MMTRTLGFWLVMFSMLVLGCAANSDGSYDRGLDTDDGANFNAGVDVTGAQNGEVEVTLEDRNPDANQTNKSLSASGSYNLTGLGFSGGVIEASGGVFVLSSVTGTPFEVQTLDASGGWQLEASRFAR